MAACSPVKFVPDGSYLLNDVDIIVSDKSVEKEGIDSYVKQKENLRILGFLKFHLWVYNLSSKKKENDLFKRIGEEPVIFNELLMQRTNSQLKQYFRNKGYYKAKVENKLNLKEKRKKINVKYLVTPGEPYKIGKIGINISDSTLRSIFLTDTTTRLIAAGQLLDVDILNKEINRVTSLFKNNGYYDFGKEQIYFIADTSYFTGAVDLEMYIDELYGARGEYYIDNITINQASDINTLSRGGEGQVVGDTTHMDGYCIISNKLYNYKPDLFVKHISIKEGNLYKLDDVKNTFDELSGLNQFKYVNIGFRKKENDPGKLDCYINLAPMVKQSVSFDVEGTNTSGNLGVAGNLNYQHRNLFGNAEIFRINLKGAMERQQWVENDVLNDFNTHEAGIESSLTIPKLLGPGRWLRYFNRYKPQTVFTLGYNYQDRPDYTRTIRNFKIGYNWKTSDNIGHTFNLVDFNMVNLYAFDPDFIDMIKDLYIKSSFTDHLIFATNYNLVYNTQKLNIRTNYKYLKFSFESAGNILRLFSSIFGAGKNVSSDTTGIKTSDYYEILSTRYAQYLKADLEFRYGYMIDKYNSVVGRVFAGVGIPYGNFDVLPFEKKYFTGGANGIRAWQVRSLGPGTFEAAEDAYPNQSSDIKLEANLEYRFRLIKMLEGAIFLDAGNIWAINDKDNREGAKFGFNRFYKQIAIGTGTGFRFDFNYFIFRLDIGMKLRDPSQELANGWIIGNRKLNNNDFNVSFAIGYPF